MYQVLLVGAGGFIGAVLRYGVSILLAGSAGAFPLATLVVNVLGSLLIGLAAGWLQLRYGAGSTGHLFFMVGVLGAFTTFSTFSLETWRLIETGSSMLALLSIVLQVVLCVLAAAAGVLISR